MTNAEYVKRAVHHTHLSHSFCWKVLRTTSPMVMPAKLPQICARYDTGGTVEEYRPYTATPTWNEACLVNVWME